MTTLTLNVSKTELENRIQKALENTMGSPIVKKRNKIINAAMVQILHGGNSEGKNEHNLDQFFKETTRENIIDGLVQKNYLKKEDGRITLGSKKIDHENIKYISYEISQDIKDVKYPVLNEKETIEDTVDNFLKKTYKKIMEHCSIHFIDFEDVSDYFDFCGVFNIVKDFVEKENGDLKSINWSTFKTTNLELVEKIQGEKLIIQKTFVDFLIKEKYINFKYSFEDIENIADIPDEIQDEFFPKTRKQWVAMENYSIGKSYDDTEPTIIYGKTEEEVTRKIITSAINFIADYVCLDLDLNRLNDFIKTQGYQLTDSEWQLEQEEGVSVFLDYTSQCSLEKQKAILMYLETLDDVKGGFTVQKKIVKDKEQNKPIRMPFKNVSNLPEGYKVLSDDRNSPFYISDSELRKDCVIIDSIYDFFNNKKESIILIFTDSIKNKINLNNIINLSTDFGKTLIVDVKVDATYFISQLKKENKRKEITICNTIVSHFEFNDSGTGMTLDSFDVYNDLDVDEHNKRLHQLFFQFCPDNDSIIEELLEKNIIEDKIEEEEHQFKDENDLCEVLEWIQENIEANELIDLIEELTMGLTKIEVSYESKNI